MRPNTVALSKQLLTAFLIACALGCGLIRGGRSACARCRTRSAGAICVSAACNTIPRARAAGVHAWQWWIRRQPTLVLLVTTRKACTARHMGNPKIPGLPASKQGCEACHGPGQAHVDDPEHGHVQNFNKMPASVVSETCLTCHNDSEHAMWAGQRACCTEPGLHHLPLGAYTGVREGQLVKATTSRACATCHKPQVDEAAALAHMPAARGQDGLHDLPQPARLHQRQACCASATTSTRPV